MLFTEDKQAELTGTANIAWADLKFTALYHDAGQGRSALVGAGNSQNFEGKIAEDGRRIIGLWERLP